MTKVEQPPELLKEIRDNLAYYRDYWAPIHKEGNFDVRFVAGDPWSQADVAQREGYRHKRPHLVFDEASQYINAFCGQARQQKRAVKVDPDDGEANAETAKMVQGRIYEILYESRAHSHAIKALKDAATRGYGWMGVSKKYSNEKGREQEPCLIGFRNPDAVLMDPDCKEYDCSDAMGCFVYDKVKRLEVKRRFKHARNLTDDDKVDAVILTAYWRVTVDVVDRLLWIDDGSEEGIEVLESELPEGKYRGPEDAIKDERDIEERKVTKYICQMLDETGMDYSSGDYGIEILEKEDWDDECIPIVGVFGEEYILSADSKGSLGAAKPVKLSMIRRARDPMGLLNLTRTTMAERMSMVPKTRWMAYEGQFEGHEDEVTQLGTDPLGFIYVKPVVDPTTNTVLPHPKEINWSSDLHDAEMLAEACQNAIRSAMGQIASPELDKTKSGIALKRLKESGDTASYHLTDNFSMSWEQIGRILGRMVLKTHDTARDIPIRTEQGEKKTITINRPYEDPQTKKIVHYQFNKGRYGFTISTGPSYDSQAQQAKDFVETMVSGNPELAKLFGDLFTKVQNIGGPVADEIIARFKKMLPPQLQDTPSEIPPQVLAELQKAQHVIDLQTQELKKLTDERDAKLLDLESKERISEQDNKIRIAIAEINAQVKENTTQLVASMDQIALNMQHQFDWIKAQADHQRTQELGAQQAAVAEQQPEEEPVAE